MSKNSTLQNFKDPGGSFSNPESSVYRVLLWDLRAELNSLVSHKLSLISGISPGIDP